MASSQLVIQPASQPAEVINNGTDDVADTDAEDDGRRTTTITMEGNDGNDEVVVAADAGDNDGWLAGWLDGCLDRWMEIKTDGENDWLTDGRTAWQNE